MMGVRGVISWLYVGLGLVILVRLLAHGWHWELLSGLVLAILLIALGWYRIRAAARMRREG
ncbi:MAG: hypothetical protein JOZ38_06320 [Candidatus Eremiobacteraeota bacterium]|nr:hypothetical protein [Candidatus Eremiobacteraeota bacterium]